MCDLSSGVAFGVLSETKATFLSKIPSEFEGSPVEDQGCDSAKGTEWHSSMVQFFIMRLDRAEISRLRRACQPRIFGGMPLIVRAPS